MGRYNDELIKAGVLLAGEGLRESALGARVKFTNGVPTVIDGPFTEAKEIVAGFWVWECASRDEAIEWLNIEVTKQPPTEHPPAPQLDRSGLIRFSRNDLIAVALL